ncbi:MAG: enoyl-CoA hydratase/isomerase family protein [Candidatus Freyarchaeota archaeon]|nr:enoyl-CoA hydratase/isomerase family protein [Candidatus Jordarchaeia archaeon]
MRVKLERDEDERIAWVRLSYPERLNVLHLEMLKELHGALTEADRDDGVCAVIITGEGGVFSAGADLKEIMGQSFKDGLRWLRAYWSVLELVRETGKLVVAAVRGPCVAGGNELAMMCDLTVAGKSARFGQPELLVGSTAMGGGVQMLPLIVGEKRARELLFTARTLSAEEAYQLGLVNRVVDDAEVESEARKLALEVIDRVSPQAFRVVKSSLKFWTDLAMLNWQLARDVTAMVWATEEFKQRSKNFLEKKKTPPQKFTGITPKQH